MEQIDIEKALNFLPYPFLVSIPEGAVRKNVFVNKKFVQEIGYTCEDIPTIDDWFLKAYPDPGYRSKIVHEWAAMERRTESGLEDFALVKAKIRTKNSGDMWYEVKASLSGPVQLVAFININDTVLKEADLARMNENKNRTLSILSHDLRMPLNNLYSVVQLSQNGAFSQEEYFAHVNTISERIFGLREFLETTLEWTQHNFDQITPVLKQVNILKTVRDIIALYEPLFRSKGIEVRVAENHFCDPITDEQIMSIVFRNILSNAVKFSRTGFIDVDCIYDSTTYCITIRDRGVGMTNERIAALLAGDYQSERGTRHEKGLGLGIKLCVELLSRVNGKLRIESRPDSGTTVSIELANIRTL